MFDCHKKVRCYCTLKRRQCSCQLEQSHFVTNYAFLVLQHFPFQGFRDSGIGSQGIKNSLALMVKHKSTVINLGEQICNARASSVAKLPLPTILWSTIGCVGGRHVDRSSMPCAGHASYTLG